MFYIGLIFALSVVIPYISIILGAMTILRSQLPTPQNLTFDYFGIVLNMRSAQEALLNSATLGFLGATLSIIIAVAVALSAYRRRGIANRINDFLSVGPDTVPNIVMAVGFILLWNAPWLPATPYGTRWILVLGFAASFLPMAIQNVETSLESLSPTFIEAAQVAGASSSTTFARVIIPQLLPGIIAGWLLAFLVGIRELVMSSLIRPAELQLLSPWIMNQFEQGHRAEAMAMTLIGVVSSIIVLTVVRVLQQRRAVKN
ncbi:ABC transporter permease subunit [Corynebacterium camporealensis]|uniref:ABC transporter permease n=1 Tax=Corynebacterium camporealensis TaxID=161896 RepID=UPI0034CD3EBE